MTDIERAHLHRSVASAVTETTRELRPSQCRRRRPPARRSTGLRGLWMRWASVATAAAMFVGVVAVGSQLGGIGGSEDSADTFVDSEIAAATSTTAAGAAGDGALFEDAPESNDRFAGADSGGAAEDSALFGVAEDLLRAPVLEETQDKSDLEEVTAWLLNTRQETRLFEPVDDLSALPCYAVAVEDDDLNIEDGFLVDYLDGDGATQQGIAYADPGTDTVEPLIRVYDFHRVRPGRAHSRCLRGPRD